ncbi:menaquinone biosynthesis protein [Helicobacter sp. 12S02634-8]|uniref:MqnA/MqnD/SBP family protein n=1 Tax=Helicobacter sp. 12S02634-8 TaxID=1476199 RepID=UPI000BA67AC3|nr:MqnA/MqnD/SBP family protein [Helicobacter sp. 12S02634-8]PAF48553.1 menaquinone biosynthesis protein [Helicobacter sp. 12S02634-8]
MRFGKIEYINLLPFDVFIKAYPATSGFKKFLQLKKSYPARLNKDFLFQRIDAGFISSIAGYSSARKHKATNSAIIAKGSVWSVMVIPAPQAQDYQSATSNALCKVLGLQGEVLIGDRALAYRYLGGAHTDMGEVWYAKTHLPFVFGRFCFNTHRDFYQKISTHFNQKPIKIPHYILMQYAQKTSISKQYILEYLKHIYYKMGPKEKLGLQRFYHALLLKKIKKPARF